MNIKLSKSQWELIGKKAGWMKESAVINDDGYADGGTPYTNEEVDAINEDENKRLSFSFGSTPEEIIKKRVYSESPSGYPMTIKNQDEWSVIAEVVNQGIDSHLEGFTRSKFKNGECLIHPNEMTTFLRRLYENGSEMAWSLRSGILETLGIEEI